MSSSVYIADYRVDTRLRLNKTKCRSSVYTTTTCAACDVVPSPFTVKSLVFVPHKCPTSNFSR